ncbi:MAG: hypothetical protein M1839_008656 [Geoglossum umbratile]|nr:MAG: hypothetical protein M1839_008656 [Geoglossum umbratile]
MKPSDLPHPPSDLLNLIAKYLTSHGFANTTRALSKDRKLLSRVNEWEDDTQMKKGDLGKIFHEWEGRRNLSVNASKKKGKVKRKAEKSGIDSAQESDKGEYRERIR